jgi:hypothetical protein
MTNYHIEFWRGAERVVGYESDEYITPAEARQHIDDLLEEMMTDAWAEDYTGCRFAVAEPPRVCRRRVGLGHAAKDRVSLCS